VYKARVPDGADLVTYWFEKARDHIAQGKAKRAGLVATNSIRGGANRKVLERIVETGNIYEAWSDEAWINAGAAVRVSLLCFGHPSPASGRGAGDEGAMLDGQPVAAIHADLTAGGGLDLTRAKPLPENSGACIRGLAKVGQFDISGESARQWLKLPNPNGRPNSDVLTTWANGLDVTRRSSDTWLIDFGNTLSESEASLYEAPFAHVLEHVRAERENQRDEKRKLFWWRLGRTGEDLRAGLAPLSRYLATPMVAKHRLFVWMPSMVFPDQQLIVIARSDDTTFGILHSHFHELWSLRMGTSLEDRPRYTPTTTFETFPFPDGLTPQEQRGVASLGDAISEAIASAAQRLDQLRSQWLNPPEWVDWVRTPEEEKAGYPARPVAKPGFEADLKQRTLTNLYNARPEWLANAHRELDAAVAAAYGWADYTPEMPDEEILRRLLKLNLERGC
jgi:type II restriction/modification system DNA methylase subunit YeeA